MYYASPAYQIKQKRQFIIETEQKLLTLMNQRIKENKHKLELYITKLEGLSPLSKLSKGYALVVGEDNKPVRSVKQVKTDELLTVSLLDGDIRTRIEAISEKKRL